MPVERTDLLVIGAGPCGLAVGVAARQAGVSCVLLDRPHHRVHHRALPARHDLLLHPERIEIGGVPFISSHEKPTRQDGLIYLPPGGRVLRAGHAAGEEVVDVCGRATAPFGWRSADPTTKTYRAGAVVFATGYYDNPNYLGIPGEDLPHVITTSPKGTPTGAAGWW